MVNYLQTSGTQITLPASRPKLGEILGWLDASELYPAAQRPSREHVLNGIRLRQSDGQALPYG